MKYMKNLYYQDHITLYKITFLLKFRIELKIEILKLHIQIKIFF